MAVDRSKYKDDAEAVRNGADVVTFFDHVNFTLGSDELLPHARNPGFLAAPKPQEVDKILSKLVRILPAATCCGSRCCRLRPAFPLSIASSLPPLDARPSFSSTAC